MTDGKESAFPIDSDDLKTVETGLTKREYFAAMIIQGLTAKYNLKAPEDQQILSQMSVELADTLITELNK